MSRSLDLDRYRQTLALPAFRRFWVGFTLSSFGDGMTRVALTWWVWETTKSAEALALLTSRIPLNKVGSAQDIARTVLFLLDSPFITGHEVHVDGGRSVAGFERFV